MQSGVASAVLGANAALTKTTTGSVTLSGINTYTGSTSVLAGTLNLGANAPAGASGALGNATSVVLLGDTSGTSSAVLQVNGAFNVGRSITVQAGSTGTATLGGSHTSGTSSFSGNILLNKPVNLTAAAGGTVSFDAGIISGSGGLTKVGNGTVLLTGTNSFTGTTSVLAGTLAVGGSVQPGANGPLGNAVSAILVGDTTGSNNATLAINDVLTFARNITVQSGNSGTSSLAGLNSSGTATFVSNVALNKALTLSAVGGGRSRLPPE